jgi:multiple sugar transport system substrate-binding protein
MLAHRVDPEGGVMRVRAVIIAAVLSLAPIGTQAADLVVWWEAGFNPEEDVAVKEIITAFEQKSGKKVELAQPSQDEAPTKALAAMAAGHPPDFLFATVAGEHFAQWAYDNRLANLSDVLDPWSTQFDRDALNNVTYLNRATGRRGLYSLPMGRLSNHVHVWRSLLERTGIEVTAVPKEWEAFWSFWCDTVQPAVRKATGRSDLYGVGLTMSAASVDTEIGFRQFVDAYEADYVTRDGRLVIDEPTVRAKLIQALASYTNIFHKGCTPTTSAKWDNRGNNEAFIKQEVVMTVNNSMSIPNTIRTMRPDDYYKNTITLGWPANVYGRPLAIFYGLNRAAVFKEGGHREAAEDFVRFLVGEGWLTRWFDFTADRWQPTMPALLEQPFWLDPGDPHRMAAAMQFLTQPRDYWEAYGAISGNWRHQNVYRDRVWPTAVQRVVTEGLSPEQAVDDAIARIKQLLNE